jgi:hypothetical protein
LLAAGGLDGQLRLYKPSSSKETPFKAISNGKKPLGLVSVHARRDCILTSSLNSELCRVSLEGGIEASCSSSSSWQAALHPTEDIVATAGTKATLNLLKTTREEFGQQIASAAGRGYAFRPLTAGFNWQQGVCPSYRLQSRRSAHRCSFQHGRDQLVRRRNSGTAARTARRVFAGRKCPFQ